jgi:putative DNA-invertase from lambdoid prophage Rac
MLSQEAGISVNARETGLTRQTIYRIEQEPVATEAALAAWGL